MVVKMMKWRPWLPLMSKKCQVRVVVRRLEGVGFGDSVRANTGKDHGIAVEIRWKGPKIGLRSLRRKVKRNFTRDEGIGRNGVVKWEEEFKRVCNLSRYKDNVFHPWDISFTVLNGFNERLRNKAVVVGTATLNLAEFASQAIEKEIELDTALVVSANGAEPRPTLRISLSILELSAQEQVEPCKSVVPFQPGENHSIEKDELSTLKAGIRKVKILTGLSTKSRAQNHEEKQNEEERRSGEEEGDYAKPFNSESTDDFEERESDEGDDDDDDDSSSNRQESDEEGKSVGGGGGYYYSHTRQKSENKDWVYCNSNRNRRKSNAAGQFTCMEESSNGSVSEPPQSSRRSSILPWKKRKLSFRSPKAKGEQLSKKAYGEEGGDDIDFDGQRLCSNDSLSHKLPNKDDNFQVGSWDEKEVKSRDGLMKLKTEVFFASIDQQSEQAGGESACTVLVAVIAHWLQKHQNLLPMKSQFDTLIQEGSLQWRNLCKNKTYKEQFPDKHFDLETVLQAKTRPIYAVPEKSFIGFFHAEGIEGKFDFLHGLMSFDTMWEEISRAAAQCSNGEPPHLYIVSWNDHFFVLRANDESYYIIDTLGERLYEGCKQAYILKFDRNAIIRKIVNPTQYSVDKEEVVCRGKEACREYIKSFLAAIPIRELEDDVKKGLMPSMPLHCRLQIELHYTKIQPPVPTSPAVELAGTTTTVL